MDIQILRHAIRANKMIAIHVLGDLQSHADYVPIGKNE